MSSISGDTDYIASIKALIHQIQDNSKDRDSLFELAEIYFASAPNDQRALRICTQQQGTAQNLLDNANTNTKRAECRKHLKSLQAEYKQELHRQTAIRLTRYTLLTDICLKIIALSEGNNWQQTETKSAKLLASLFLLSAAGTKKRQALHKRYKPLYRVVLALRLLDKMLVENAIDNHYITSRFDCTSRFSAKHGQLSGFQRDVAIPVIIAALVQDIGMQHPEMQGLLKGSDGSRDEFRVLDKGKRSSLLLMNHEQTAQFIVDGIGIGRFHGETEEQRELFLKRQKNRQKIVQTFLNSAIRPQNGIGNILKTPHIYASVVLSTKPSYQFDDLPKTITMLNNTAHKGAVGMAACRCFSQLIGQFPQGFGIVYVEDSQQDEQLDDYFYAIVTRLNPQQIDSPICRRITASGEINTDNQDFAVAPQNNLYYRSTKTTIALLGKAKLERLRHAHMRDLEETKWPELLEGCWNPHRYFCVNKHQRL